ncbi:DegV family protein [Cryptosporangium arvum]|uniref:EDD domain protein, DegV family n=1 Tax=Cryptosporangium arvum DSM 44712 TaxID=927661 RepID=A0A011AEF1_9ACTN|nr:DegV family protein [Cryptosporangium arvum]EXG80416.1 EDD domain protein, DegV family [Cryptosporangium arvum DSM 44712]
MAPHVAVVTDSTSDIPRDLVARYDLTVVPTFVTIGEVTGREGVDISSADVAAALKQGRGPVTTSRATPHSLGEAYRLAFARGYSSVVSIHLSAGLSGTYEAAMLASASAPGPVTVVDSRSIAMGLGAAVLEAAGVAQAGGSSSQVASAAVDAVERSTVLFYVDTLEHLRRGGRISAAAALIGTTLSVKPILRVEDGQIVVAERVRTSARALAKLEALAVTAAGVDGADVVVQHLAAPEQAEALRERLFERVPRLGRVLIGEVGPTVGTHVGPGLVGVAVTRHK